MQLGRREQAVADAVNLGEDEGHDRLQQLERHVEHLELLRVHAEVAQLLRRDEVWVAVEVVARLLVVEGAQPHLEEQEEHISFFFLN